MKFVATKTTEQLDLQALHRVRERLVCQRTGIINQIRAFLLERSIAVRQGLRFLQAELPTILGTRSDALSPRMLRLIEDLAGDWRRLDARIEAISGEIEELARKDQACERLMTVPGIGPIISSAMVVTQLARSRLFRESGRMRADIHDGPEQTLQSEAGYSNARPHQSRSTKTSCTARPDHTHGSKAEILAASKCSPR